MKIRIKPAGKRHIPKNICRDYNGGKDYYVYCDLTGWRIFASEAVTMPKYSGVAGLIAHKSYAYGNAAGYTPFVPPSEKGIPWTRTNHTNTTDAADPAVFDTRGVIT